MTTNISHLIQEGKLFSFFDFHSRPVAICSRSAATSAVSLVMARSIFLVHRLF